MRGSATKPVGAGRRCGFDASAPPGNSSAAAPILERNLQVLPVAARARDPGMQGIAITTVFDAIGEIVRGVLDADPALAARGPGKDCRRRAVGLDVETRAFATR